jgi:FkbM family methyltransferase
VSVAGLAGKLRDYAGTAMALGTGPGAKLSIFWRQTKNVRVRFGLGAYHPDRTFAIDTSYGRLHLRDNFGDITNLPGLLYHQVYRVPVALPAGAILDVGANIGLAAAWLAHTFPGRPIHCFEPLVENVAMVRKNCPGARVSTVAVGREPGRMTLRVDPDGVMASSIPTRWETGERDLEVITLDDYTSGHEPGPIALLKMDTEGMELDILDGATDTLARTHAAVMETHGRDRHAGCIERLEQAGFVVGRDEFDGATGLLFVSRPAPADASARARTASRAE